MTEKAEAGGKRLMPHISRTGAWSLSIGVSIGWGSLVITSSTYLSEAGPAGSVLGMIAGMLIMLVISKNYHYMMNCCPDAGGSYAFARDTFGHDHGFLVSWFLTLTYLAVLWANATALPLFARYFIGDMFEFGRMYSFFGYDVYLGEALLTVAAILLTAVLCSCSRKASMKIMIGMAMCFTAGIMVCSIAAILGHDRSFSPAFTPDSGAVSQILHIAAISPWAFIGFESISHASEEFSFRRNKSFRILAFSVISTAALYILVTLLSASAYPERYGSWLEYIRDLPNLDGIEGLPAFYAASHYLGQAGTGILMAALLSLVCTSLIGNTLALSRLFYSMGKDRILPERCAALNRRGIPGNAVWLIAAVSLVVPFLGRTAIGWIVDITTLGATLIYGFTSACAAKRARIEGNRKERITGIAGMIIMIGFGLYLLVPNLFSAGSMETETYFLFVVWSVAGFIYFRIILKHDDSSRFGQSIIVWIALLSLVLFVSLVWMSQSLISTAEKSIDAVEAYYQQEGIQEDIGIGAAQLSILQGVNARSMAVVVTLFGIALGILVNNYSLMSKKAKESTTQLGIVRDMANTDPLTGVKSKHAYVEKVREINEGIRNGTAAEFAIAVCDVNGLKQVNDTLGHQAGDQYIRKASDMICGIFVHSPVYRIGGDEFAVYLNGHDYEAREELMKKLHDMSEANIKLGEAVVSGGLSDYAGDSDVQTVVERADAQMYREKQLLKSLGAQTR